MNRISKEDYYLNIAKAVSLRSTCLKRQYGAVIVNNDEIIATGYNGSVRGGINCCDVNDCIRQNVEHNTDYTNCRSVHAEQNALLSAPRRDMNNGDLYLYGSENSVDLLDISPCPTCERMIRNAGIKRIICKGHIIDLK